MSSQEFDQNGHSPYCPSFSTYSNNNRITEIATRVTSAPHIPNGGGGESDGDDFEFHVDGPISGVRPVYPVFDRYLFRDSGSENSAAQIQLRELFFEEDKDFPARSSSESSSAAFDDLDGVPPGSYCLWTPRSPVQCTKSNSTGSGRTPATSKSWRLRNLLRRCKSDGKEGLVLIAPKKNNNQKEKQQQQPARSSTSFFDGKNNTSNNNNRSSSRNSNNYYDYYNKGVVSPIRGETENRRRSYLPYKQDILGFFGSPQTLPRIKIPPF